MARTRKLFAPISISIAANHLSTEGWHAPIVIGTEHVSIEDWIGGIADFFSATSHSVGPETEPILLRELSAIHGVGGSRLNGSFSNLTLDRAVQLAIRCLKRDNEGFSDKFLVDYLGSIVEEYAALASLVDLQDQAMLVFRLFRSLHGREPKFKATSIEVAKLESSVCVAKPFVDAEDLLAKLFAKLDPDAIGFLNLLVAYRDEKLSDQDIAKKIGKTFEAWRQYKCRMSRKIRDTIETFGL